MDVALPFFGVSDTEMEDSLDPSVTSCSESAKIMERKVNSAAEEMNQTPKVLACSEYNFAKTLHSSNRSPESVLDESQSRETPDWKELSPKIKQRLPKIWLNLDISDPGSDISTSLMDEKSNLRRESLENNDETNSVTEKLRLTSECVTIENPDEKPRENVFETVETVSMEKTFSVALKKMEIVLPGKNFNYPNTRSRNNSTNPELTVSSYIPEKMRDNIFDTAHLVVRTLSNLISMEKSNTHSGNKISKEESNHIGIELSRQSERQFEIRINPSSGLGNGLPWLSELDWYTRAVKEIFPTTRLENFGILRIPTESKKLGETKISKKQQTSEKMLRKADQDDKNFTKGIDSPPTKRCRTILKFENEKLLNGLIVPTMKVLDVQQCSESDKIHLDRKATMSTIALPVASDLDSKTTDPESHVMQSNSIDERIFDTEAKKSLISRILKLGVPLIRISKFCRSLARKIIILIQRSYEAMRRIFKPDSSTPKKVSLAEEDLSQMISLIRFENDKMLTVFTEKVNCLSVELSQIRVINETALKALTTEVNEMRGVNGKLIDNNDLLLKEFKYVTEGLEKLKSIQNTKFTPSFAPPPPPPPPPPPAFPPITPTTPNSSRDRTRIRKTPTRKCSTPLLGGRPCITVEDLLKVTLKKAPQKNNNKENRRHSMPRLQGPVVSTEMLQSVKLKSARRRVSDTVGSPRRLINNVRSPRRVIDNVRSPRRVIDNIRSPRGVGDNIRSPQGASDNIRTPRRAYALLNRATPCPSISPIMAGEDSPLDQILRQVNENRRRRFKRTLSNSNYIENDATRESPRNSDASRHNESHSIIA